MDILLSILHSIYDLHDLISKYLQKRITNTLIHARLTLLEIDRGYTDVMDLP
jgi:hypothetical protein